MLIFACLLVAAPLARAEEDVDEKDVVVLTDKNFNETIAKHKFALIEFYAPWCGHCKSLKPVYAEAATKIKEVDAEVLIAKVDATEEKDLGTRFSVAGFPTLKWFVDGEPALDYNGGRSVDDIVNWVKKKTGPATTVLESTADLEKAKEAQVSLFAFFEKFGGDEHDAFEAFAAKTDDASFFKTTDAEIAKAVGIVKAAGYAAGRNFPDFGFETVAGEGHAALEGDAALGEKLAAFLTAEKLPAFLEFNQGNSPRIFGAGIDHQIIVVAPQEALAEGGAVRKEILAASAKTRGKVVWVITNPDAETAEPIINFFGLDKESKDPQVVGFLASGGKKYALPEDEKVTAAALEAFALAVVDGTAARRTKSAAVPAEPTENGVTIVVGSTFDSIVKDPTKDVLLEVYAPWCGHCKALTPIYEKLAKRFKDIDSVVIAKMDGTENEVADVEVQGFPTILLFPAEKDAKAVDYNEPTRELKDLTKFIKKHAKVEYELPKKAGEEKKEEAKTEETQEVAKTEEATEEEAHDEL